MSIEDISLALHLLFELLKPLDQFRSQIRGESQHSLPRQNSIRSTSLIVAILAHKTALPINLQAPKNILGPGNPSPIWRIPRVAHVYPSASIRSSHSPLVTCCSSAITAAAAQVETAWSGEHRGLLLDLGVMCSVGVKDGLQYAEEVGVFSEG